MGKREEALRVLAEQAPAFIEPPYDRGFPWLLISARARQPNGEPWRPGKNVAVISETAANALHQAGLSVGGLGLRFDRAALMKNMPKLSVKAKRILGLSKWGK